LLSLLGKKDRGIIADLRFFNDFEGKGNSSGGTDQLTLLTIVTNRITIKRNRIFDDDKTAAKAHTNAQAALVALNFIEFGHLTHHSPYRIYLNAN
jgi:hypothetical protein